MDVKHGVLDSSLYQDSDLINRFENFIIRVSKMFESYSRSIVDRYRQIFELRDVN